MPRINPEVQAAAELFCDGEITDRVLADVAAMRGLQLYDGPAPEPVDSGALWQAEMVQLAAHVAEREAAQAAFAERLARRRVV